MFSSGACDWNDVSQPFEAGLAYFTKTSTFACSQLSQSEGHSKQLQNIIPSSDCLIEICVTARFTARLH